MCQIRVVWGPEVTLRHCCSQVLLLFCCCCSTIRKALNYGGGRYTAAGATSIGSQCLAACSRLAQRVRRSTATELSPQIRANTHGRSSSVGVLSTWLLNFQECREASRAAPQGAGGQVARVLHNLMKLFGGRGAFGRCFCTSEQRVLLLLAWSFLALIHHQLVMPSSRSAARARTR